MIVFNRRGLASTIPLATAALIAAGCGAQGTTEAPQQDLHGAPSIDQPLDTSAFEKDPCKTLEPAQLQRLGITVPGETELDKTAGPGCTWEDISANSLTEVTFATNGAGLQRDYAKRNEYPNFKELPPVAGYPAVAGASNDPIPPEESGTCDVHVGVSNDLTFLVQSGSFDGPDKADPCGKAQQVAGEVVQTLQAGK